ncbi:MAG: PD-(D/E)XK nuclease family protein [Proteobacteria bacterium]|nr:PD-(D/E)XK nuclease family protein [Pseudomonadota bacterium]
MRKKTLKIYEYTPILGWSTSRYGMFRTCKKKYFYHYYGKFDEEYPRSKIEELKNLTSIPLEIGNIVHDTIRDILRRLLKSEKEIDKGRLFDYTRHTTETSCNSKTFDEVYYKKMDEVRVEDIFEKIIDRLYHFLDSDTFSFITTGALPSKGRWIIEQQGYGETRIEGMKAYCKVDFVFPVDDKIYILDWKTGRPDHEKHRKQLLGYAYWVFSEFDTPIASIIPIIVYLNPQYKELRVEIGEGDIQGFARMMKRETEEMYAFCRDIEQNIPRPKEVFEKTDQLAICNYCNFKELCFPESMQR